MAANKFRKDMKGYPEQIFFSEDGAIGEVARGSKGAAVINFTDALQQVTIKTSLPAGKYTDAVHQSTFEVSSDSILTGNAAPLASYLLYRK